MNFFGFFEATTDDKKDSRTERMSEATRTTLLEGNETRNDKGEVDRDNQSFFESIW